MLTGPSTGTPSGLGRFQILRVVGEGAFGIVYEVRDRCRDPEARYALKVLHRKRYRPPAMLARAVLERQVLKAARHPCIVMLHCAFRTTSGELALVTEYCPNGDLNDFIVRRGRPGLPEAWVRRTMAEVLLALQYLHEDLVVVFRDLKPENVVLDAWMRAKLTDFGLAQVCGPCDEGSGPRSFVGSPYYVAPEVSPSGEEPYGPAVDLYALGLVTWVCLTGGVRMPIEDEEVREIRVPLESHEAMRAWLGAQQTDQAAPRDSPAASPSRAASPHMSAVAHAWISQLASRDPGARGTARSLRLHEFFRRPGFDPPLACDDDWSSLLPLRTSDMMHSEVTPEGEPVPEDSSSAATDDTWTWEPTVA